MYENYERGDIVLYFHQNNGKNYVGIVVDNDLGSDEDGHRLFFVQMWSALQGRLGNRLYLRPNQLTMVGKLPEGTEWDLDD